MPAQVTDEDIQCQFVEVVHSIDGRHMTDEQHMLLIMLIRQHQSRNDAEYERGNIPSSRYNKQNREITKLLNLVEGK